MILIQHRYIKWLTDESGYWNDRNKMNKNTSPEKDNERWRYDNGTCMRDQ